MPQNFMHREVHEVPVIHLFSVLEIHRYDFITSFDCLSIILQPYGCQLLKFRHKNQETTESHLMPTIHQQFWYFIQWEINPCRLYYLSRLRHLQAQKLIALAILAWPCLKEPHQHTSLLLILQRLHIAYYFLCLCLIIHYIKSFKPLTSTIIHHLSSGSHR